MCSPQSLYAHAVQSFGRNRFEEILREIELFPDVGVEGKEVRHAAQTEERTNDGRLDVFFGVVD